jgi:hypothetical protein
MVGGCLHIRSLLFLSELHADHEPDLGRAGSPLRAVVAMPIAKEISEMAARISLAPQRGGIKGEG